MPLEELILRKAFNILLSFQAMFHTIGKYNLNTSAEFHTLLVLGFNLTMKHGLF
jgi:hypothetical protein